MRGVFIVLVVLGLAACGVQERKLAFNRYAIEAAYGGGITYNQAVDKLVSEAESLCDKGYRKVHDYDTVSGSKRVLTWDITCKGVDRSNSSITATPPPK